MIKIKFDIFINEYTEAMQFFADKSEDAMIDASKPSIFQYTIYRLPSYDEIMEFANFPNLSADEILKGFKYTMIGRGILSKENKNMIQESLKMLINNYPNIQQYKDALESSNNLKPKF